MISRRELLQRAGQLYLGSQLAPFASALGSSGGVKGSMRCINVVNFIRAVEPRFKMNLMEPVERQMEIILHHKLPATWLLQLDALVSGPFVPYLKAHRAKNHEVGFWFEMNELHCKAAGVEWRGRPAYEWDHIPHVAFTIGYTQDERIKLADTAMAQFKKIWGHFPHSVASWNLDSFTIAHLVEKYKVDAFAVCRDQIATDGFTIWGAPIAGYYPSKGNCWSPSIEPANQIHAPIFRMLGQDPVRYYNRNYKMPDGSVQSAPDTMEPVWPAGRSETFIQKFLEMISESPTMAFAYAQLGQENSFPWEQQAEAYPKQMAALADLQKAGAVHVETMGETGRRFKKEFRQTPVQAQVMVDDPFGIQVERQRSVWYQSRYYRANLHFWGDLPYLRDLTVYRDDFNQPFLDGFTRETEVEQRLPAVVDGYHWSRNPGSLDGPGAGGFFKIAGQRVRIAGNPSVAESGTSLSVSVPLVGGDLLDFAFAERYLSVQRRSRNALAIDFQWDPAKSAFRSISGSMANYQWRELIYGVALEGATAKATESGWIAESSGAPIRLTI
ncbi:MAG: hypothetical protein JST40_02200 [Armatimonadetes bacterium]|nr:hypothetical protein [Armatimonadota bacterium]